MSGLRVVYIGCGKSAVKGAINLDNSPSVFIGRHKVLRILLENMHMLNEEQKAFIDVILERDIRYGTVTHLPFKNGSVDVVYSSHTIEHLYQKDFIKFMDEADRVLKPDGVFRMAIPDLSICVDKYKENGNADEFCTTFHMGFKDRPSMVQKVSLILFGDRKHKWMYDGASMKKFILENSKFTDVVVLRAGETTIKGDAFIDLSERKEESVYLECRR